MATHPKTEAPWQLSGSAKGAAVQQLFAEIAPVYDRLNGVMSLRLHHRWRRRAVNMLKLQPGAAVLDLCTGTGDFLSPLRKAVGPLGKIVGIDFCSPMLEIARQKGKDLDCALALAVGDACQIPIRTNSLDGITVGWGMRNVGDIRAAHQEAFRVLRPGGAFASLDCAIPSHAFIRMISRWVGRFGLPALGKLFGNKSAYTYLPKSVEAFATREQLRDLMTSVGFHDVKTLDLFFGNICISYGVKR